jgi:hypothetical protein
MRTARFSITTRASASETRLPRPSSPRSGSAMASSVQSRARRMVVVLCAVALLGVGGCSSRHRSAPVASTIEPTTTTSSRPPAHSGSSEPTTASTTTTVPKSALPAEPGCLAADRAVRPTSFVLACADGNVRVDHAQWSVWTTDHALGAGTVSENDCEPYCAAGHFHSQTADLLLDQPVMSGGRLVFARLRARLHGQLPPNRATTLTFELVSSPRRAPPHELYHGGVVIHDPAIRVVVWGPAYPSATAAAIETLIRSLAGSSYAAVLTEYFDTTGPVRNDVRLAGAWTDPIAPQPTQCRTTPAATCVTVDQMIVEATRAIAENHWPVDTNTIVLLLLPPAVHNEDSCGAHISLGQTQGPPALADVGNEQGPCDRGWDPTAYAEFATMHELAEAITDPFNESGWWDLGAPNPNSVIGEIADACDPNGGNITMQDGNQAFVPELYSLTDHACRAVH